MKRWMEDESKWRGGGGVIVMKEGDTEIDREIDG